ncbi:MAG: hypothetical protein IT384_04135 [Deltaproteobacteria bacterium]|nr:hypothetical protein [Deltaproteobacteria bacterium]
MQIHTLRTSQRDLYPVDMRLRPSGTQGPLVASLQSFQTYHQKTAQLWERQALVRSGTVAGSPASRTVVDAAIEQATYGTPAPPDAAALIRDMRERLAKEHGIAADPEAAIDLKQGTGGLMELDFLTQFLLLVNGHRHPDVRSTSTRAALERLGAAGAELASRHPRRDARPRIATAHGGTSRARTNRGSRGRGGRPSARGGAQSGHGLRAWTLPRMAVSPIALVPIEGSTLWGLWPRMGSGRFWP